MSDVMSTQQNRPYILSHFSRLTPRGVRKFSHILSQCSHYIVASEGDTAVSSCEQSLLSRRAEVLPLAFVVMPSLIVASGHYLLALQSRSAISTTRRLHGDCIF